MIVYSVASKHWGTQDFSLSEREVTSNRLKLGNKVLVSVTASRSPHQPGVRSPRRVHRSPSSAGKGTTIPPHHQLGVLALSGVQRGASAAEGGQHCKQAPRRSAATFWLLLTASFQLKSGLLTTTGFRTTNVSLGLQLIAVKPMSEETSWV